MSKNLLQILKKTIQIPYKLHFTGNVKFTEKVERHFTTINVKKKNVFIFITVLDYECAKSSN